MRDSSANIVFRAAFADEVARAASIREDSEIQTTGRSACFVAVKDRPVERIVGAAFWWMLPCEAGKIPTEAEFEWTMVASLQGSKEEQDFLEAIRSEVQRHSPGVCRLAVAAWFPEANAHTGILQAAGFQQIGTRHFFQGTIAAWQQKIEVVLTQDMPDDYSIAPPASDHFEAMKKLLCYDVACNETCQGIDQKKPLRPFELARGLQTAGGAMPSLFDPRCSGVLLNNERVVGACLANLDQHGHLSIKGLALANSTEDSHRLVDHLLGRTLLGAVALGASGSLSYGVKQDGVNQDGIDIQSVEANLSADPLAQLADRFPVQSCGTVHRYGMALSAC